MLGRFNLPTNLRCVPGSHHTALPVPAAAAAAASAASHSSQACQRPSAQASCHAPSSSRRPPAQWGAAGRRVAPPRGGGRRRLVVAAAMFDDLSTSLQKAWKNIGADGRLTPENIKEPLKDIRRALLEADVSLPVVRRFIKKVEEAALGVEVIDGVTPQTAFVKVVNDQLVELMGEAGGKDLEAGRPQIILMAGLQGVGKTTAAAKLARFLQRREKSVLLVATDVYRPAAIDQLVTLGQRLGVPVFEQGTGASPVDIAAAGVARGRETGVDAIIVDTAGRLQVDADMMAELTAIKAAIRPTDTLLVVDAMTGQEAAALVKTFDDAVDITGALLTKMDGDARGGAALSVREVSGKPIKFVGTGEKMDALELFYPERMAQRILGMGDVLTLYEKAKDAISDKEVRDFQARLESQQFDFTDFLSQWKQINNMGGLKMLKMMPGFSEVSEKQLYEVEKKLKNYEAMIASMTPEERATPELLISSPGRRRRIAQGAGRGEEEVAEMMSAFTAMRSQATRMGKIMAMGKKDGATDEQLMKDLVKSVQVPVPQGMVRRKRDKAPRQRDARDKSRGFSAKS